MKKKLIIKIVLVALVLLFACVLMLQNCDNDKPQNDDTPAKDDNNEVTDVHVHSEVHISEAVIENRVESTCNTQGSYDKVVYCSCGEELYRETFAVDMIPHDATDGICNDCSASVLLFPDLFVRCDKDGTPNPSGKYILLGEYPQTIKSDDVIITSEKDERGYYLGSDNCYYLKTVGRPYMSYMFSTGETIIEGKEYYFKVEPILWRILCINGDKALLLSDMILINHKYGKEVSVQYDRSEIRNWLNGKYFYEKIFSDSQKTMIMTTTVDNSAASTGIINTELACGDTEDKVFLLSYAEVINPDYGFAPGSEKDTARLVLTTDFARATGVEFSTEKAHYGYSWWILRSPSRFGGVRYVDFYGYAEGTIETFNSKLGIVPAMWVDLTPEI